ncbi:MAG: hypothetical protein DHS20C14_06350 [Phycisphaeraceae bacterium]|nr:MAG: hypothetical protein DHS20C14_06350 [Phycisphaeraceae bacterium]
MSDLDLRDPDAVCDALRAGAQANRDAACRSGSIDRIEAPGKLIATGDLHDNPVHFARLVHAAGLGAAPGVEGDDEAESPEPAHLTLHEIIHSDRFMNGMDFSYRALARVAALKAEHPELVHTLLANHELAQVVGAGIVKHGVRVVEAFNDAVEYSFGEDAPRVTDAINTFVRSMPLALRCVCPAGDILCAHSVPGPAMMGRFDASILSRELTDDDYAPRVGSAHFMVWGRGYDAELLEDLTERWGVNLFILGHEHAEHGFALVEPNALVLNSDHERGVYLPIDLEHKPRLGECAGLVKRLGDGAGI